MKNSSKNHPSKQHQPILFSRKDPETFTRFYTSHYPKLYSLCYHYTKDPQDAKDLLHEVILKIWEHPPQMIIRKPMAWMGTFIHRHWLNVNTKQQRRNKIIAAIKIRFPNIDQLHHTLNIDLIYKCIDQLQATDKQLTTLHIQGYKPAEIAESLQKSPDWVYKRKYSILRKLNNLLTIQGFKEY